MFPAKVPRVASDRPVMEPGAGMEGVVFRMCLSERSERYCFTVPLCWGIETVTEIESCAAAQRK